MATNLASVETEVLAMLVDASGVVFDDDQVDQCILQTLRRINQVTSYAKIGTITLAAASREISLSSLTAPATVTQLWLPYTAAAPEDPPNWRTFEQWTPTVLYVEDGSTPEIGNVARVFYSTPHTLDDLDSASDTTLDDGLIGVLVSGSIALALLTRWRVIAEALKADPSSVRLIADLRDRYNQEFIDWMDHTRHKPAGGFEAWT